LDSSLSFFFNDVATFLARVALDNHHWIPAILLLYDLICILNLTSEPLLNILFALHDVIQMSQCLKIEPSVGFDE